jgi:hypothetical protein
MLLGFPQSILQELHPLRGAQVLHLAHVLHRAQDRRFDRRDL